MHLSKCTKNFCKDKVHTFCVLCTPEEVHDNNLEVRSNDLDIYVYMTIYVLRLEILCDYEAGDPGCR